MKIWRHALPLMASGLLILIISCHTETPLGIDTQVPQVRMQKMYNTNGIYYNSEDTLEFVNFEQTVSDSLFIEFNCSDNQDIYKVSLIAEDWFSGIETEIKTITNMNGNPQIMLTGYVDFPITQDIDPQKFYLKLKAFDSAENSKYDSLKFGFKVPKPWPFSLLYSQFGELREVNEYYVDFKDYNGELAFVQFISFG